MDSITPITMTIGFDVDGTLLDYNDKPRDDIIELFNWFKNHHHKVIIWSGGGAEYAETIARRLGLEADAYLMKHQSEQVDIAVDDEFVKLGRLNLKV